MKRKQNIRFIALLVFLVCVVNVYAQDWPQFLGPERNSTSPQENILRSWPEQGPEVLWSVNVGIGYGGAVMFPGSRSVPAIDDDQVYTCGPYGDLYCVNITTHKPVWNKNIWTDFGGVPGSRGWCDCFPHSGAPDRHWKITHS